MTGIGRLRALVGDLRHLASVRRAVLSDGPERGLEVLLIAAGPLAMTVLAGRAMDIGTLTWHGAPIGWTGPSGFVSAAHLDADAEGGRGFGRGLSGFLMTGGLTHIRQPARGEPLHGRLPFTPARVIAAGEDWEAGCVFCEAVVRQTTHGGENLVLRRRIEVPVSGEGLRLRDVVTNEGSAPVSPELLYHFNLGYPAIRAGTSVRFDGREVVAPIALPEPSGAVAAWQLPVGPGPADCVVSADHKGGFAMRLSFSGDTLPCLQFWRNLTPGTGIFSVEPCTSMPGTPAPPLAPGDSRRFEVAWDFAGAPPAI